MTNKLKYFVANWKMFGNLASLKSANKINYYISSKKKLRSHSKIILCLPNTLIYFFKKNFHSKFISLGAQNCHQDEKYGSYTGSVSSYMLKNVGAKYVILGHSENRITGESNNVIKKKIKSAINQKLKVILCVGETLNEKNRKKTFSVIKKQIISSLGKKFNTNKIIIAYEPVWAIGSGKIPKTNKLEAIFKLIKKNFKHKKTPVVLYGGSVNAKNIRNFSSVPNIDGFLIGGASQTPKKFIDIIKNYYK